MSKKLLLTSVAVIFAMSQFNAMANDNKPIHNQTKPAQIEQKMEHGKNHLPNFEKREQKLAEELNLSDEQKEMAKKIREDGHKKAEPLMKQMKEIRTQLDNLRKENMKEFEKILTKEQLDKFEKIKEEGKNNMMKKRHHRKPKKD